MKHVNECLGEWQQRALKSREPQMYEEDTRLT